MQKFLSMKLPRLSGYEWGEYRQEMRDFLLLAVPLVGAQLAQISINTIDVLMIGRLGAEPLAASTLAFGLFLLVWLAGLGLLLAVVPIAAGARSRQQPREMRRVIRMGIWAAVSFFIPAGLLLWQCERLLLAFGQEPNISALAGDYMRIFLFSMLPSLILIALRNFLTVMEQALFVFFNTVLASIVNATANYILIFGNFGAPRLELVGAAIGSVIATSFSMIVFITYIQLKPDLRQYALFTRLWRPDWPVYRQLFKLGLPISATLISETSLFGLSSLMLGWIGTIQLAAHGVALQLASIAFMIPLGYGHAAMVRIGLAAGRNDDKAVARAGWMALTITLITMVGTSLIFLAMPEGLALLFLSAEDADTPAIVSFAAPFILMVALVQIFDGTQGVVANMLRGLSDTRTPMMVSLVGYLGVGCGSAYLLGFVCGWDGIGVWLGLGLGLGFVSIWLTCRFARRRKLGLSGSN